MVTNATDVADAQVAPQHVPVNMYEAGDAVVIVAPLPAVQPDDVTIDITPGRVRLAAHLRSAAPKDYLLHEWHYGLYEREVPLPEGFGADAQATLANGQLALRILRGDPSGHLTIQPVAP
jgi:HSP20 family molecular chaperone IbpA